MGEIKTIDRVPCGTVTPPPSKSVSHRALICAGLAHGTSVVEHLEYSEDIIATMRCLQALGIVCETENDTVTVRGGLKQRNGDEILDCGESGSTLRFMLPIALLGNTQTILTGHGRLMHRPMEEYFNTLRENGATIVQDETSIAVRGPIAAGTYRFSGSVSSQFVTGLLLALPLIEGISTIELTSPLESKGYVDLSIDVMNSFGVTIENKNYQRFTVTGGQSYQPCRYAVETDYSAAAFFLAAGALGCDVACAGLNPHSLQGDRLFVDILKQCGITVTEQNGVLKALPGAIRPITVDVSEIPDLVPPLAALLCFAEGTSRIVNAARLRMKESDRLHTVTTELNKLGADITEGDDDLIINGLNTLTGGSVDAHNDHRIAMMAALASIRCIGEVILTGAESVKKSYPAFWNDFCKTERSTQV